MSLIVCGVEEAEKLGQGEQKEVVWVRMDIWKGKLAFGSQGGLEIQLSDRVFV